MNKSYYLFLIIILLLFINGCEEENQIQPTFQGVIISRNADPIVPIAYEIDQEDPYHNFDNEKIEDKIRKRIQLPITNTCDFYVDAEEELYLIIKVYNPEEYDILSCVINDVRYQSYQFTSKSNYQNIIIPFNSKKEAGKVVLKVNEIQYSDGNKLKEIIILENNSVSYGVNYQKSPSEKTDKMAVKATSVSFEFTVSDSEGLIERAGNILKVFLYDGKDIIYENDLLLGVNEIEFNNLKSNTLYQFAIITVYDLVDGEGLNLVVLHKEAFYTQKLLQLISVTPTADEISFELQINDQDSEGIISALELYKGKELIASISKDLRVFTSLESNTDYQLKIVYSYGEGLEEVLEVALKTHKQEASVDVEIYDLGKTSFSYQFLIVDEDLVSKITKIALYLDKQLIETKDFEAEPCFVELLSNRIYCLEVTYVYDLADGKGEQTKTCLKEVKTSHLLVPEVTIENT
ncbi:MAG: hypothetical protein PHX62_03550, partial [Bacilli bacterium]|nr:hypothetical protein [Bacilli bacterium]